MGIIWTAHEIDDEVARDLVGRASPSRGLFRKRGREVTSGELFELMEGSDTVVDLDKAWHAIHWLLVGSADEASTPEGAVILGGTVVGGDPPMRVLTAPEVRAIDELLQDRPVEVLAGRFDPEALRRDGVYPEIWDEEGVFDEYVAPIYEDLRAAYRRAAERSAALLLALM